MRYPRRKRYPGRRKKYRSNKIGFIRGFRGLIRYLGKRSWAFNLLAGVASFFVFSRLSEEIIITGFDYKVIELVIMNLQLALPVLFIIAAFYSAIRQGNRKRLLSKFKESDHLPYALSKLSWRDFELLVGQLFRERNYSVLEGIGSNDGGVDLTLKKSGKTYLVQCKHWRKGNVGVSVVRELYGVISLRRAEGGYVVCSGRFTKDAAEFARKANVKLIGISDLEKHLT